MSFKRGDKVYLFKSTDHIGVVTEVQDNHIMVLFDDYTYDISVLPKYLELAYFYEIEKYYGF